MLRLFRYLRPFTGLIVLIIALLYAQAMADLALPDYMSKIVNTGIQQHGIDSVLPEAILADHLDKLDLLMAPDDMTALRQYYQLLKKGDLTQDEFDRQVKIYPKLAEEDVYVLADRSARLPDDLRRAVIRGLSALESILSGTAAQMMNQPEGTDLFAVLSGMTPDQRSAAMQKFTENMPAEIDDSMREQYAIAAVKHEYETIGMDLFRIQSRFLIRVGGLMLLVALAGAACSILVGLLGALVAAGLGRDVRLAVFSKVERFSNTEFDKFSTASLITRSSNDVQRVQLAMVMVLRTLFYAPILGTGGVIRALDSNTSMAWIIAAAVAVMMLIIIIVSIIAVPRFKLIQKLVDRLNLVSREILSGLMVIRAFNTQSHEEQKFDSVNRDLTRMNLFVGRLMALLMPLIMLIMNFVSILIIWIGARQIDQSAMMVGDLMAFIQYTMQIIMSFIFMAMLFIFMPQMLVSAQRIGEILAVEPQIADPKTPVDLPEGGGGLVEFQNVTFQYPGADTPVLEHISFTALPGQTTAIIGSTGCGKSTLVHLLPRFYDVSGGKVLIDGVDVRQANLKALRQKIGFIAQKAVLFSGDIRSNIAYGRDGATDEDIRQAAETAQALEFIEASEDRFDAPIDQGGTNVSGGQKQRLSIARALVKKPPIYVFDDTFSSLDFRTDAALRKALREQTRDATVLIVAQRIGTIRHAEKIVVLDKGAVVGTGTHEELMKTCEVYREIALSQLSEEELAI